MLILSRVFTLHGYLGDENYSDLLELLKSPLEENSITKIGYDLKYQKQVLHDHGVSIGGVLHDTMVMHYLLEPDKRHNMQYLFESYVKDSLGSKYLALISDDNRKKDFSLDSLPVSELLIIKSEEVDFLFQLSLILNKRIKDLNLEKTLLID